MKSHKTLEAPVLIPFVLRIVSLFICFGALFVPFAVGLKSTVSSESGSVITEYGPAFSFLFGGKISTGRTSYNASGTAIVGTVAYAFLICAAIALIAYLFIRRKNFAKYILLGAAVSVFVASIMMLCSQESAATVLADSIMGRRVDSVVLTMKRMANLQFGFWGVSLLGFFSGTFLLSSFVFDGSIDKIRAFIISR